MISPSVSHDLRRGVSAPIIARLNCSHDDDDDDDNDDDVEYDNDNDDDDNEDKAAGDTVIHLMTQSGSHLG